MLRKEKVHMKDEELTLILGDNDGQVWGGELGQVCRGEGREGRERKGRRRSSGARM